MTDSIYREFILDLYRNPLNKKELDNFDLDYSAVNPTCGDEVSVQLKFDSDGKVGDVGFQGTGCAISIAAVSLITEKVKGMKTEEIASLGLEDIERELGVEIDCSREKCAAIGLQAIMSAVNKKTQDNV